MEIKPDLSGDYEYYYYKIKIIDDDLNLTISGTKRKMEDAKFEAENRVSIVRNSFLDLLKNSLGVEKFKEKIKFKKETYDVGRPYMSEIIFPIGES